MSELKALRRAAAGRCLEALRRRASSQCLSSAPVLPGMLAHITSNSKRSRPTSAAALPSASDHGFPHAVDSPDQHTYGNSSISSGGSSSSDAEMSRHMPTSEASQGAGQGSRTSTARQQASSSSGNRKTGRNQQAWEQAQLRLLCRTMAQVRRNVHGSSGWAISDTLTLRFLRSVSVRRCSFRGRGSDMPANCISVQTAAWLSRVWCWRRCKQHVRFHG